MPFESLCQKCPVYKPTDPKIPKCNLPCRVFQVETCDTYNFIMKALKENETPYFYKSIDQKALELCREIEKLPASELQTKISLMASELRYAINRTLIR